MSLVGFCPTDNNSPSHASLAKRLIWIAETQKQNTQIMTRSVKQETRRLTGEKSILELSFFG